ncbi:hypothetical protein FAGAP_1850 [Fusarium agapanthi]|uniref:Uncharacterized protein n=1 Tax=Fusarium agapanthi TaxID=1803897 RepID=A0A9P5BI86_9HYPO|nr:hypothetical protein FAGAP_1850 [Fusarium agapanthi]
MIQLQELEFPFAFIKPRTISLLKHNSRLSSRYQTALARMNYLHSRYRQAGKILDDDLLHTLRSSVVEIYRIFESEEWRPLSDVENCAVGVVHMALGQDMEIPFKPLPSSSTENVTLPTEANDRYVRVYVDGLFPRLTPRLTTLLRKIIGFELGDIMRESLGLTHFSTEPWYTKPSWWTTHGPSAQIIRVLGGKLPESVSDTDWSHLCDYDCANISGVAGVVHQGMVVLALCFTPLFGASSMSCIIMSPQDIGNPKNRNTTVTIDGVPSSPISVFVSKTDPSDIAESSVRLVYCNNSQTNVIEMVLDMLALAWYSCPRPMLSEQSFNGVTATGSPDGTITWVNFLTITNGPNGSSASGVMFNNSSVPSNSWTNAFTYGDNHYMLPWTMAYLYGDLIAVWPSDEKFGWTIKRPGGSFDLASWMKTLSDDCLVSELSIPGTRASATSSDLTLFTGKHSIERRQNMNIIQQLNAGVRFLHLIVANELNASIAIYTICFVPTALAPTLSMSQLRGKILIMHTLNQSGSSSTAISTGIDLGASYPDPLKPDYKQIRTLTTESGIQFTVQDYAGVSVDSASEAATEVEAKKTLVNTMLSNTAATGTFSSRGNSARYPPQQASTWFLNWMNFMTHSLDSSTENGFLITAKSINSMVIEWLKAQNSSKTSTDWWPRPNCVNEWESVYTVYW